MRYILTILSIVLLTSCNVYKIQKRQPEISHIVAITNAGDTIQVPIEEFQRRLTPQDYSGWNIYWNNSWWLYNDWYWNYWNPRLFSPRYYIYTPRPRVSVPQRPRTTYVPRHFDNRPNPPIRREQPVPSNRGRSSVQPPQSYPRQQPQQQREVVPQQRRGSVQQIIPNNNRPLRRIEN